jgi:hypothetical protein
MVPARLDGWAGASCGDGSVGGRAGTAGGDSVVAKVASIGEDL